jgi:hypothetical protein
VGHTVCLDSLSGSSLAGKVDTVATVVADEVNEVLDGTATAVVHWGALGTSLEELDSRETLNLIGNVVHSRVNLGDNHFVGVRLEHLRELIVLGGEGLAVAAPWGVELEENVFLVVDNDVLVVLGHNNSDGTLLFFGDRLALDGWLDLAGNKVIDECADVLGADVLDGALLGEREFEVLGDVLDSKSGPAADLEVEVACVLAESFGVNGGEVDLALVRFSNRLQVLGE